MNAADNVPWKISDALVIFLLPWIGLPLAVAVYVVLGQYVFDWPLAQSLISKLINGDISVSFGFVALEAAAAFFLVSRYLRKYSARWSDLGLRRFSLWKAFLYLTVAFVAFIIIVFLAYVFIKFLIPGFNPNQEQANDFAKASTPAAYRLSFLALVVIAPVLEEIVFRGFMFPAFIKRFGVVGAAVVSSLLFGLAHLQSNIIVYTVILGLVLCLLYRKLGSIWPGIGLHMFNNYLAFTALMSMK